MSALWSLRGYLQSMLKTQGGRKVVGGCAGLASLGPVDWFFDVFDFAGACVWWWISFISAAADPTRWSSMSFAAWTVVGRHVFDLYHHPYSCALARLPRWTRRAITWTCQGLLFAQWCATMYATIFWTRWTMGDHVPLGYRCLQDKVASAPGTSPCSPAKLCSEDWMFKNQYYGGGARIGTEVSLVPVFHVAMWSLFAFFSIFQTRVWKYSPPSREQGLKWEGFLVNVEILATAVVILNVVLAVNFFKARHFPGRYGGVYFSEKCHALHVTLSPWKHFLDANTEWRELWIAKAWMDA